MNIELKHDDCLEAMKAIPDKSIDLIITDPPYLHVKGGSKCKRVNKGVYAQTNDIKAKMSDFGEEQIYTFLNVAIKKCKMPNMYIFCSKLQIPYYLNFALENKLNFDVLIWDKCAKGLIGHKAFATNIEYIIRIYKDGCGLREVKEDGKLKAEYYQKIHSVKRLTGKKHPAQKPIELLNRFVLLSSDEGDTIFDPFMGSGSVGVSCVKNKRNFIGVELDDKYFEVAKERIGEEINHV